MTEAELQQRSIDVVRGIAMDAPRAANSGHPGTAMALAPLAYALWGRVLRFDPSDPRWPDRDRFVLSAGHASILQYTVLHLTGYDLSLDELRNFRQWGSLTPGHPEVNHTEGVECTTGPLGQGFANAVGMAIAEESLRARFGADLFDHHTFVIAGDGDLMEGISHEAASLAGHLRLGRLVVVYDDNHITIDGPTELTLSDDPVGRFESYGWHVIDAGEISEDVDALEAALLAAKDERERPTLIRLRSHIGHPSPAMVDTADAHGAPFAPDEIATTKSLMGLPPGEAFHIPDDVAAHWRSFGERGRSEREEWESRLASWSGDRQVLDAALAGTGLLGWDEKLPTWEPGESVATRNASKACLESIVDGVPGLVAGSADLTGNTGVAAKGLGVFSADYRGGRLIHYGVREMAMGAIMNGMSLHGGALPVGGTFFVFSDYMRAAVRLSALSDVRVIFSWSHDSVGIGEDGPTHQPVEHLASLRAMPGLRLIRPADANETAMAWRAAVDLDGPTALILSRQNLRVLEGTAGNEGVLRGAYVLRDVEDPDLVLVGTGAEVALALETADELAAEGVAARVVSMPSWELFEVQDEDYQAQVLGEGVPRLSVEAGTTFGWHRWVDDAVGIDRFGASAPGDVALAELGMNVANVAARARALLATRTDRENP